jgi:hypothetical protein
MIASSRPLRVAMAALRPGAAGLPELARGLREADWREVIGIANWHLVTPAMYHNLREAGLLGILPSEAEEFLRRVHELNARRNERMITQLAELLVALRADGIESVLLKAAADLPTTPEPRLGERIASDLDVLIRPADLKRVRRGLRRLGYARDGDDVGRHSDGNYVRPGEPAGIDLHLRVEEEDELLPAAKMWDRSVALHWRGTELRIPCPEHRVVHLVLHDMLHHGGYYSGAPRLRALHDLRRFIDAWHGRLDWRVVDTHFQNLRLGHVLDAHLLAAHRLLGAAWPLSRPPSAAGRFAVLRFAATTNGILPRFVLLGVAKATRGLAWHRMHRLYGSGGGSLATWRLRHLIHWTAVGAANRLRGHGLRMQEKAPTTDRSAGP